MILILALIQVTIFLLVFHRPLKKRPNIFYGIAVAMVIFLCADGLLQISADWPEWIRDYILSTLRRGSFSTALFIVVMFIGALDTKRKSVRSLMKMRAELSIFASIFTFGHNLMYGYSYFPMLFTHPWDMEPQYVAAAIVTLILLILLIPLFITSLPKVRRKMAPRKWKRLQCLAYPFYILIYVHVLILFIPRLGLGSNYTVGVIAYTVIYISYVILRLRKYINAGQREGVVIPNSYHTNSIS
ncbi:MAG: ferric reductase-like transmembrane domain-containing protein [Muricomes sp.]